jgi:hypothetical protein
MLENASAAFPPGPTAIAQLDALLPAPVTGPLLLLVAEEAPLNSAVALHLAVQRDRAAGAVGYLVMGSRLRLLSLQQTYFSSYPDARERHRRTRPSLFWWYAFGTNSPPLTENLGLIGAGGCPLHEGADLAWRYARGHPGALLIVVDVRRVADDPDPIIYRVRSLEEIVRELKAVARRDKVAVLGLLRLPLHAGDASGGVARAHARRLRPLTALSDRTLTVKAVARPSANGEHRVKVTVRDADQQRLGTARIALPGIAPTS